MATVGIGSVKDIIKEHDHWWNWKQKKVNCNTLESRVHSYMTARLKDYANASLSSLDEEIFAVEALHKRRTQDSSSLQLQISTLKKDAYTRIGAVGAAVKEFFSRSSQSRTNYLTDPHSDPLVFQADHEMLVARIEQLSKATFAHLATGLSACSNDHDKRAQYFKNRKEVIKMRAELASLKKTLEESEQRVDSGELLKGHNELNQTFNIFKKIVMNPMDVQKHLAEHPVYTTVATIGAVGAAIGMGMGIGAAIAPLMPTMYTITRGIGFISAGAMLKRYLG